MIDAIALDKSRVFVLIMQERLNFWHMGGALVNSISAYQKYRARRGIVAKFLRKYSRLRHLLWSVITGSQVDPNATIGDRLTLPHANGIVIHGAAVIGDDCMIMQQVTIGQLSDGHVPVIGSHVYIGAGAKILGKVVIGDGAKIGANAVVLCDVPANCTAVGVPARVISPHTDSTQIY